MRSVQHYHCVRQQREPTPEIEMTRGDTGRAITIAAAQLIAQYETNAGDTLLILDEDTPYEEQVHLALIRADAVIDHLVIGAPYATGLFREVGVDGAGDGDALLFRFNGDEVLRVEARAQGSRMPERLPPGTRRKNGWFAAHHLSLSMESPA